VGAGRGFVGKAVFRVDGRAPVQLEEPARGVGAPLGPRRSYAILAPREIEEAENGPDSALEAENGTPGWPRSDEAGGPRTPGTPRFELTAAGWKELEETRTAELELVVRIRAELVTLVGMEARGVFVLERLGPLLTELEELLR
jgi:hypothetical protein